MLTSFTYLNWDNLDHRAILVEGPAAIAKWAKLDQLRATPPFIIFDEIHKYKEFKTLLKGFFDSYAHAGQVHIVVTGSARLDVYHTGGDSLMGRYFRYRVHPLSVAELLHDDPFTAQVRPAAQIKQDLFDALFEFGGFPEPFLKASSSFYENWRHLRTQQFFYEDIREMTQIQEVQQMELLALHLKQSCGNLTSFSSLSKKIRVSNETVRRWVETLKQLYYCFTIHPWSKNVPRSLLKEPKFYLWDWAQIDDLGQRAESLIASHLLKACHYWTDRGMGTYQLYFLRNKEKQEVDFLVTKNESPWFLAEVKLSDTTLNPHLAKFQKLLQAPHAFQIVFNLDYEPIDCFSYDRPIVVSAQTFLSQLV